MRCNSSVLFATATLIALAAPAAAKGDATFTVLFENDIFFDTDREYTNGVGLAYTPAAADTPEWAVEAARTLPFFADSGEVRAGYTLAQNMYTPEHYRLAVPIPTERPYAGYLYAGIAVVEKNANRLDQLQVQIGVVGPLSLAENAQKFIHAITCPDRKPLGWDHQLKNEPAVELIYERSYKLWPHRTLIGLDADLVPHFGWAVGTVYDYANAGFMVRYGYNLPDDLGPVRLQPGMPGANFFDEDGRFSFYWFAGIDGRAIARNIFLDGNTWRDGPSVAKRAFVGDLAAGIVMTYDRYRLSFTHVFRTREYKTQDASIAEFGGLALSVNF